MRGGLQYGDRPVQNTLFPPRARAACFHVSYGIWFTALQRTRRRPRSYGLQVRAHTTHESGVSHVAFSPWFSFVAVVIKVVVVVHID